MLTLWPDQLYGFIAESRCGGVIERQRIEPLLSMMTIGSTAVSKIARIERIA